VTDGLVEVEAIVVDLVGTGVTEGLVVTPTGGLEGVGGGLMGGVGTYK
jgi:hypothetical protein